jgi:hypothetical protein
MTETCSGKRNRVVATMERAEARCGAVHVSASVQEAHGDVELERLLLFRQQCVMRRLLFPQQLDLLHVHMRG